MGMFDNVLIEGHGLPSISPEQLERAAGAEGPVMFQTKDLENYLGTYVVRAGRLHERIYEHENVPEEERPYYGKPEWDEGGKVLGKDFYRHSGSQRIVGHHDRDLEYHGDLVFYAIRKDLGLAEEHGTGLLTFRARFTEGDLQWIKPHDEETARETRE